MAFPRLWELLFGSSGGTTILSQRLPDASDEAKGAVTLTDVVPTSEQTLTDAQQLQALKNLGVIQAITELIQDNGGTVPTDTNSVSTASVQSESTDEFAEYDDE